MLIRQKPMMSWIFTWPSPTPWGTSESDWGVSLVTVHAERRSKTAAVEHDAGTETERIVT